MADRICPSVTEFRSLEQIGIIVGERWRRIGGVAAIVLLVICAVCAALPSSYTANVDIIFNPRASDPVADKADTTAMNAYVSGEVDLINSREMLFRLAGDPTFANDPLTRQQANRYKKGLGPQRDWLIPFINKSVTVTNVKNSRRVTITAVADDRRFAALMANGLARWYLWKNLSLRVMPEQRNVAFFAQQKAQRLVELNTAQQALQAFLKTSGMSGLEAKSDVEDLQLRSLGEKLSQSQTELAATAAERAVGGANTAVSAGTISNAALQALRSDIATQSAALSELAIIRGPNYPAVVQTRARLSELEGQFRAETGRIEQGLQRRNAAALRESRQIGALERDKRLSIGSSSANRGQLALLSGEVERAKAAFDAVALQLVRASLAASLGQPNAAILSPATPPLAPTFPRWPLIIVFGVFAGLACGIMVALASELIGPRVRSVRDLEWTLGAPVLCDMAA